MPSFSPFSGLPGSSLIGCPVFGVHFSYNDLAVYLADLGKYHEAWRLHQKALQLYKELLGEQHPETATSYSNLAQSYDAWGKHRAAQRLHQKALDLRKQLLGELHPDTAHAYSSLAANLDNQGRYRKAQPLHQTALDLRKKLMGERHPDTANSYNGLGCNLKAQGYYAQAKPLLQKALNMRKQLLGEHHPDIANSYNNLASNFAAQGNQSEAQVLFQKALDLHKRLLGEQHPETATTYNNLAHSLAAQRKHAEAQVLFLQALELCKSLHGEQHPETARGYNNLAANFVAQENYEKAQALSQKALEVYKGVLSDHHPYTASTYNNLAVILNAQGKYDQAQLLLQKTLDLRKSLLGELHPHTASSYASLAAHLDLRGQHSKAQPLHQKSLDLHKQLHGPQHPATASSYNGLAYNLDVQGKHKEALRAWQAALLGHDIGRLARASSGFDRATAEANVLTPRQGLAVAHARTKEPALAWEHAEADLARGLLDDLGEVLAEDAALLDRLKRLDEQRLPLLSSRKLSEDQNRLLQELSEQHRDVLTRLARDLTSRSTSRVWSLQRIQKRLPGDAALVFWISTFENWGCVLRASGEPRWQRLLGPGPHGRWTADDYEQPARLHAALADNHSSPTRRRDLIEAVRRRWFGPLRQHLGAEGKLPAVRRLFVVPSGWMSSLPVEVIAPKYVVSYTSSGTTLAQTLAGHRPLQATAVLALGNPVFTLPKPPEAPAHGLFVTRVEPNAAARAEFKGGDVLLSYRGIPLQVLDDLKPLVVRPGPATAVRWRDGKKQTLTLPAGHLGLVFDPRSAPAALRAWRKLHEPVVRVAVYKALPGTRYEVETLRRLLGNRCQTLLGSDASEQKLDELVAAGRLKQFRLLHLATHGHINLDTPALTALILARDRLPSIDEQAERAVKGLKVYTGELRVGTILKQWKDRLDCDLVVLSACDTGLGRKTRGQGLLGFAHALQVAGARSVVLSRWKVDDTATALLMVRFYENLLGSRKGTRALGRAEALAEAKTWLRDLGRQEAQKLGAALVQGKLAGTRSSVVKLNLKDNGGMLPAGEKPFAHPVCWAAFTLLGDPD